jgi:TatD DNase family protein
MTTLWDAHIHLERYGDRAESLVRESVSAGVGALVAVSMDLASSERTAALAEEFPDVVRPAYGFHPEQDIPGDAEIDALFAWMERRAASGERFAVGEVGLPYYSRLEAASTGRPFDEAPYVRLLERFVAFAVRFDLPLALHAVYEDAHKACDALEAAGARRAHFHWFKGDERAIERIVRGGWRVSFTPDCLYDPETRPLLGRFPLASVLTETDGPWPFEGPYEGRETHPAMIRDVTGAIAKAYGLSPEEAAATLARNAERLYGR